MRRGLQNPARPSPLPDLAATEGGPVTPLDVVEGSQLATAVRSMIPVVSPSADCENEQQRGRRDTDGGTLRSRNRDCLDEAGTSPPRSLDRESNALAEEPEATAYTYSFNRDLCVWYGPGLLEGTQTALDCLSEFCDHLGEWKPIPEGFRVPRPENADALEATAAMLEEKAQQSESDMTGSDYSETERLLKTAPSTNSDADEFNDVDPQASLTKRHCVGLPEGQHLGAGKEPVLPMKKVDFLLSPAKGKRGRPSQVQLDEAACLKNSVVELIASSAQKVGLSESVMRRLAGLDGPARFRESNLWNLYLQVRAQTDVSPHTGFFAFLLLFDSLLIL